MKNEKKRQRNKVTTGYRLLDESIQVIFFLLWRSIRISSRWDKFNQRDEDYLS